MRRSRGKGESGQASVMIGMIILTFVLFFAFVINTGMLVNAKINLQNAADLAAYAGAATQARQLNQVAYLNYEMRRQYKKFLFRYYVLGSLFYDTYPTQPGQATRTPRDWSNKVGGTPYGVPVVCLNFFARVGEGNYCAAGDLPAIKLPPQNSLDAINEALREQLRALEGIRAGSCQTIANTNLQLLSLWLFNTSPTGIDASQIDTGNQPAAEAARIRDAYKAMKGVTYGLGLVPRELMIKRRIDTLQGYLNTEARAGLNREQVEAMKASPDPTAVERSINAFSSAFETLGEHSFPEEGIFLDELLPPGVAGSNVASFKPILQDFDTYALAYERKPSGGTGMAQNNFNNDCVQKLFPISVRRLPLGVYKDPTVLTYYAVRLRAKAKVLFSPFGDIELKAYSAAMPFGSRIGPTEEKLADLFARPNATPPAGLLATQTVSQGNLFQTLVGKVPNLPVADGETADRGQGWDSNFVQYHYRSVLVPPGTTSLRMDDLSRGAQASMVPNPWEAGRYSIINDLGNDPFVRNFDKYRVAAIWAPLVPLDQSAQLTDLLRQQIDELFANNTGGAGITPNQVGQFTLADFKRTVLNALTDYVNRVRMGQGEGDPYTVDNPSPADVLREGMNVAILTDPLYQRPTDVPPGQTFGPITLDPGILMNDPAKIRDAWAKVNDGLLRKEGRVGYSVKFVSFDSLRLKKFTSDGKTTFTNEVGSDGESEGDLPAIRH